MSADEHALERVTADLIAAGLSSLVAPTPARTVLARVRAGEDAPSVVQEVAADWLALPPPSSPKTVKAPPAKPQRRVLYTVAGHVPLKSEAT